MNEKELIGKVHSTVYHQCQRRGYAAPVDVLMEVGVLQKQKYEDWRFGRVDYLERVCTVNLRKLSFIMRQMQVCAQKSGLKSSFCYYKQWGVKKKNGQGHKPVVPLRFSKSGNPEIENGMQLICGHQTGCSSKKHSSILKIQISQRTALTQLSFSFWERRNPLWQPNASCRCTSARAAPRAKLSATLYASRTAYPLWRIPSTTEKLLQVAGRSG